MHSKRPPYTLLVALLLVLPALGPRALQAQASAASVSGVILEARSRNTIEGADVILVDRQTRTSSSSFGEFTFEGLEPGLVVLRVEHPSYVTRTDTVALAPGERVEVRLTLSAEAIELEPINVVARRGTLGTGLTGRYPGMTRTEIEEVIPRTRHLADVIRTGSFPGVRVHEVSFPGFNEPNYCVEHPRARSGLQGPGSCVTMNVFVDGRPVLDPGLTFATMDPNIIERFEILGPIDAAAIYGAAGARGVVLIETRSGRGATERRLPVYARDLAPLTLAFALTRGSGADLYAGAAIFTYNQEVTTIRYEERSQVRPGLRASLRMHTWGWFPEVELTGFLNGGESTASYLGGQGQSIQEVHDFNSLGAELVVRPRVTKGARWDLSMLLGPVWARESLEVQSSTALPAGEFAAVISDRLSRTWSTVGAVIGAEFEWVLNPRSSILVGGRWRGLTMGDDGATILDEDAEAGRELLQLPQAQRRNGRKSLEVGYVLRLGAPPS